MSTREINILGITGTVAQPFEEGHVVTAAEAKVLNQTRAENISNNARSRIKALRSEDETFTEEAAEKAAEIIAEIDANYVFTLASVGARRVTDPLEREVKSLATSILTNNIRESGMTVKEYKAQEGGEERYAQLLEQVMEMDAVIAKAKELLDAKSGIGDIKL